MENKVSLKITARMAGLIYFAWIVTGLFSLIYIPSQINTDVDAAQAAQNVLAKEFLYRTGIVNSIINSSIWVFLVLILYRLFKPVNERHAKLLFSLVIVQVPAVFILEAFNIAALMTFKGEILKTFELNQRQDLAMMFLNIGQYGVLALEIYWGLWLLPLGMLVYKSFFIPRFLGVWLLINGVALLVLGITSLWFPQFKDMVYNVSIPAMFGEVAFMLWLLIKGVKNNASPLTPMAQQVA